MEKELGLFKKQGVTKVDMTTFAFQVTTKVPEKGLSCQPGGVGKE